MLEAEGLLRAGPPAAAETTRRGCIAWYGTKAVDTFKFEYSAATREFRSRYLNLLATDFVAEGIGSLFVGESGLGKMYRARLGLCPVPAGAPGVLHHVGRDGEPPERGGGDEDPPPGAQDLPDPRGPDPRRSRLRRLAPAGEPSDCPLGSGTTWGARLSHTAVPLNRNRPRRRHYPRQTSLPYSYRYGIGQGWTQPP